MGNRIIDRYQFCYEAIALSHEIVEDILTIITDTCTESQSVCRSRIARSQDIHRQRWIVRVWIQRASKDKQPVSIFLSGVFSFGICLYITAEVVATTAMDAYLRIDHRFKELTVLYRR